MANVPQSSKFFLSLLESFYPSGTPSLGESSVFASSNCATDGNDCQSFGVNPIASDPSSEDGEAKAEAAATVMTLQLLTCYVGLIDLHILSARITVSLIAVLRQGSASSMSLIFPDMRVGGVFGFGEAGGSERLFIRLLVFEGFITPLASTSLGLTLYS